MLRPGKRHNNGLPTSYGGGGGGGYGSGGVFRSSSSSSSSFDNYYSRKRSKGWWLDPFFWVCLAAFLFFCTTVHYRGQINRLLRGVGGVHRVHDLMDEYQRKEREASRWKKEAQTTRDAQRRLSKTTIDLRQKNRDLQRETERIRLEYEKQKSLADTATTTTTKKTLTLDEEKKLRAREAAWRKQVYVLQNATARESKREALERFGGGPHHVEFRVKMSGDAEESSFVVKMAPLALMPHAVHLFLEQVHHELWDKSWLYLNGPHVLQAGPEQYHEDEESALRRFKDVRLDRLAYPEYSPEYPHVPFTLGFTGRPGGPDWYINKVDNTQAHGPGGQYQHHLQEQADPCFGQVVEGQDVLARVFQAPVYPITDEAMAYVLKEPVQIVKVRIQEPTRIDVQKPEHRRRAYSQKKVPKRPKLVHKDHTVDP